MQNKQLWALIVGMGLVSGGALAQQPPRQESPEVTAAEMEAMKEAAAAGGNPCRLSRPPPSDHERDRPRGLKARAGSERTARAPRMRPRSSR